MDKPFMIHMTPNGTHVKLDMQLGGTDYPWCTLTKKDQKKFHRDLFRILDPAGIQTKKAPAYDFDKPQGGVVVKKGEHGCITVQATYSQGRVEGVSYYPVFLPLSYALSLCHFMHAVVYDTKPIRKRTRPASGAESGGIRKRKRKRNEKATK